MSSKMNDDQIEKDAVKEIMQEAKVTEEQQSKPAAVTLAQVASNPCINKRLYFKNLVSTLREPLNPKIVRKRKVAGLDCDLSEDELLEKRKKWQSKKLVTGKDYDPDTEYIYDARKYYDPEKEKESMEYRNKREAFLKMKEEQQQQQQQLMKQNHPPQQQFVFQNNFKAAVPPPLPVVAVPPEFIPNQKPFFKGRGYFYPGQGFPPFRGRLIRSRGGRFLPHMGGYHNRGGYIGFGLPGDGPNFIGMERVWGRSDVPMRFYDGQVLYPDDDDDDDRVRWAAYDGDDGGGGYDDDDGGRGSSSDDDDDEEEGDRKKRKKIKKLSKKKNKRKRKKKSKSCKRMERNDDGDEGDGDSDGDDYEGYNDDDDDDGGVENSSDEIDLKRLKKELKRKKLQLKKFYCKNSRDGDGPHLSNSDFEPNPDDDIPTHRTSYDDKGLDPNNSGRKNSRDGAAVTMDTAAAAAADNRVKKRCKSSLSPSSPSLKTARRRRVKDDSLSEISSDDVTKSAFNKSNQNGRNANSKRQNDNNDNYGNDDDVLINDDDDDDDDDDDVNNDDDDNCDDLKLINEGRKLAEAIKQTELLLFGLGNCISFAKVKHYTRSYYQKTDTNEQLKVFLSRRIKRSCSEVGYFSPSYLESLVTNDGSGSVVKSKDDVDVDNFDRFPAEKSNDFMRKYKINRVIKSKCERRNSSSSSSKSSRDSRSDSCSNSSYSSKSLSRGNTGESNSRNKPLTFGDNVTASVVNDDRVRVGSDNDARVNGDNHTSEKSKTATRVASKTTSSSKNGKNDNSLISTNKSNGNSSKVNDGKSKGRTSTSLPKKKSPSKSTAAAADGARNSKDYEQRKKSRSRTPKKYVSDYATGKKYENLQIRVTNSPFYEEKPHRRSRGNSYAEPDISRFNYNSRPSNNQGIDNNYYPTYPPQSRMDLSKIRKPSRLYDERGLAYEPAYYDDKVMYRDGYQSRVNKYDIPYSNADSYDSNRAPPYRPNFNNDRKDDGGKLYRPFALPYRNIPYEGIPHNFGHQFQKNPPAPPPPYHHRLDYIPFVNTGDPYLKRRSMETKYPSKYSYEQPPYEDDLSNNSRIKSRISRSNLVTADDSVSKNFSADIGSSNNHDSSSRKKSVYERLGRKVGDDDGGGNWSPKKLTGGQPESGYYRYAMDNNGKQHRDSRIESDNNYKIISSISGSGGGSSSSKIVNSSNNIINKNIIYSSNSNSKITPSNRHRYQNNDSPRRTDSGKVSSGSTLARSSRTKSPLANEIKTRASTKSFIQSAVSLVERKK